MITQLKVVSIFCLAVVVFLFCSGEKMPHGFAAAAVVRYLAFD